MYDYRERGFADPSAIFHLQRAILDSLQRPDKFEGIKQLCRLGELGPADYTYLNRKRIEDRSQ
jgi:hypothetical protein